MPASYPKPDGESVTRHKKQFSWVTLPAGGRKGRAPALPVKKGKKAWSAATKAAWKQMWATPQATQWDQSGVSMHRWALAYEELQDSDRGSAALLSELRQIEDRHGLNPKAMLQLRWRVGEQEERAESPVRRGKVDERKVIALRDR